MTDPPNSTTKPRPTVGRRWFITVGAGLSASLLAGCATETATDQHNGSPNDGLGSRTPNEDPTSPETGDHRNEDTSDDTPLDDTEDDGTPESSDTQETGTFRLLITDLPADIGDFESLYVSFDEARVFGGRNGNENEVEQEDEPLDDSNNETTNDPENSTGGVSSDDSNSGANGNENGKDVGTGENEENEDPEGNGASGTDKTTEEEEGQESLVTRGRGFYTIDLSGAEVDLTTVVNNKAELIADVELSTGKYTKIELYVAEIEPYLKNGVYENDVDYDPEEVAVRVPSGKLMITRPFEIQADGGVDYVVDINVVRRGQGYRYNLRPVISGSGVNGKDINVEEIDDEDASDDGTSNGDPDDENNGKSDAGDNGEFEDESSKEEQDDDGESQTG